MHRKNLWLATLSLLVLAASPLAAQTIQILAPSNHMDGTMWFHSELPKKSAGSAQLGTVDTGDPPAGLGLQAVWLEWTEYNVYAAFLGGGSTTAQVTTPGGAPISNLLGAATLNGGFIETYTGGTLTSVVPGVGSFLWTPGNLYLLDIGGALVTAEVTDPGGAPITDVQGVAVIASQIFDLSLTPGVVAPHIIASALVYTPTAVWHVDVDLSGGISFVTTAVSSPSGGPIAKTRGASVMIGIVGMFAPPPSLPEVRGAAFIWNDTNVFLLTQFPAVSITEVLDPAGGSIAACWGVMVIAGGLASPVTPRGAALIWKQSNAFLVTVLPAVTVLEATDPGGAAIVSGVAIQTVPASLPVERQASYLYEIRADYLGDGSPRPGLVLGQNQRSP